MRKFLQALALSAALLWMPTFAQAAVVESTETDDLLNAVGELTSELRVQPFTNVSIFVNGTYVADAFLQREVGSPGSGSFENVAEVTAAANATVTTIWTSGPNPETYRIRLTAYTSGAVLAQMTDNSRAPQDMSDGAVFGYHTDDFHEQTTAVNADFYVVTENDAGGTVGVLVPTLQEGVVQMITGTGDDAADEQCFSHVDLSDTGALVSDGRMMFETLIKGDDIGAQMGMALHDEECVATQLTPFDIDSNAIVFNSSNQANAVAIMYQDEASDATAWHAASANNDTLGNNADEFELGVVVVADTYARLRIEIDSTGDCFFFVANVLRYAENECVQTSARLVPFWWINTTTDGTSGASTMTIQWYQWAWTRPSS